ncbi:inositol hexakisphosphate kinase 1-like [Liolophura sinensis]|uniref:inositol hexakisphosphate kinase 1-like n=1 Tax=Liolophura sinensis TaxID=3198878 RepID=UPI003158517A
MPEQNMESGSAECQPVELQPFIHQVGGHTSMFRFNENTVCKPLCSREYHFYSTLPQELHPFTPEFKGSIEVQLIEDSEGYVTFVGYPSHASKDVPCSSRPSENKGRRSPDMTSQSRAGKSPTHGCYSMRLLRSGSIEMVSQTGKQFSDSKFDGSGTAASLNPWSISCHKRQMAKMRKSKADSDSDSKFILLENVAAQFRYPCVLDLKMGTRQHGDDAPESKKKSQMMKCETTTSATIGLRICGMQVYQASSGKYICHNKYYGRSLSVDGFKQALHQFLHNGHRLRTDVIHLFVAKLQQLYTVVEKQETFRFYSSSLLMMYDGAELTDTSSPSPQGNPGPSTPHPSPAQNPNTDNSVSLESLPSTSTSLSSDTLCDNHKHRTLGTPSVDVRMIDFAHATHKDFLQDVADHNGPDRGYLFGLENLTRLLREFQHSYSTAS